MSVSARNTVYVILTDVFTGGAFLNEACERRTSEIPDLDDRDFRFILRLSKGVTERKITLEAVIGKYSSVPVRKMKPQIRLILCMAVYQILYMDTEDYAAVNEAVKLAVKKGFSGLKGFVNAVLRKIVSDKEHVLFGLKENENFAMPPYLFEKLNEWYGHDDAIRCCGYFLSGASEIMYIRRNTSLVSQEALLDALEKEGAVCTPTGLSPDTYSVKGLHDLKNSGSFRKGYFYIQDLSSALSGEPVRELLENAADGFKVLDCCAAPGGKALHIADMLKGKGSVLCCDISEQKAVKIRENIERSSYQNMTVCVKDAAVHDPDFDEAFDLVTADVPCSGLGIIGQKPDIKYRVGEKELGEILSLQEKILMNVKNYVKPGGVLLYSTCTLNPEENTGNRDRLLKADGRFSLVAERQFLPGRDSCDGFYYAVFRKA